MSRYRGSVEIVQEDGMSRLVDLFHATEAFQVGKFTLASGVQSPFYINVKKLAMHPEGMNLICEGLEELLDRWCRGRKVINAVGGPELGAVPIVGAMVQRSFHRQDHQKLDGYIVRREVKEYGIKTCIDGAITRNHHTALIEDVVTSGKSVLEAANKVWQFGASTAFVMTVVDREEGGKELLAKHHMPLLSVLTLKDLLK